MKVICLYFPDKMRDYKLKDLAEIFYRYTPQIAVHGELALFLEISKCERLYPLDSMVRIIKKIMRQVQLNPRMAWAEDPSTALSLCVYQKKIKEDLPLEALPFYLNPFVKDEVQGQHLEKMRASFARLGVHTLRDFLSLPVSSLSSRFGRLGLYLHEQVSRPQKVWPFFVPEDKVIEKLSFQDDWHMGNLEVLTFYLKTLLDRVVLRLKGRGEEAKSIQVIFRQEKFSTIKNPDYSIDVSFSMPQLSTKAILALIKEKVEHALHHQPLQGIVESLSFEVKESIPLLTRQKDIFNPKKEEHEEAFGTLLARLSLKLGEKSVFQAQIKESHLPEKTWRRCLPQTQVVNPPSYATERPLRMLQRPEKINACQGQIFIFNKSLQVESLSHREVILSEWWNGFEERIYFRAKTTTGEQLWLFQSRLGVFLHGYFD